MHRRRLAAILLLIGFAVAVSAVEPRFVGKAGLAIPVESNASADGRFSLNADLRPAAANASGSRFDLVAKLQPDVTLVATACGPVGPQIFQNGFE